MPNLKSSYEAYFSIFLQYGLFAILFSSPNLQGANDFSMLGIKFRCILRAGEVFVQKATLEHKQNFT